MEAHLTAHLELYLSGVALAVALVVPLALELGTDTQELAGAALAACVLQGWLHWLLRRRAARVRRELIAEVRGLLRDRINNHLQVVMFSLAGSRDSAGRGPRPRPPGARHGRGRRGVPHARRAVDGFAAPVAGALRGRAQRAGQRRRKRSGFWKRWLGSRKMTRNMPKAISSPRTSTSSRRVAR